MNPALKLCDLIDHLSEDMCEDDGSHWAQHVPELVALMEQVRDSSAQGTELPACSECGDNRLPRPCGAANCPYTSTLPQGTERQAMPAWALDLESAWAEWTGGHISDKSFALAASEVVTRYILGNRVFSGSTL
jgi:hypothetical protein